MARGISNSCLVQAVKHATTHAVIGRRVITEINKRASKNRVNDLKRKLLECQAKNMQWHAEMSDVATSALACSLCVSFSCTESVDLSEAKAS